MKQRLSALLLAAALGLSLCACASDDPGEASKAPDTSKDPGSNTAAPAPVEEVWSSGDTVYFDVPARAGGGTDMLLRFCTTALTDLNSGVNFVVSNYDTGEVGVAHAANADKDGLTISVVSSGNVTNYYTGSSEYNPSEAFVIVAKLTNGGPQALVASADFPCNNMSELIEHIRSSEKKVKIGVALGSTSHFAWLNTFNAIDPALNDMVSYVQSGGEADKLTNIASGSIDLANCSMNNAVAYQQDGKLKVLGILGPDGADRAATAELVGAELGEEFASLPEQGIDYCLNAGTYLVLPAGTDPAIVEAVNAKLMELNGNSTYEDGMKTMGQFSGVKNVADSQADFAAEVDEAIEVLNAMDMNTRK